MKKFILQRRNDEWEEWRDQEETFTFEESRLIHENHPCRYDYQWRILEVHTLG